MATTTKYGSLEDYEKGEYEDKVFIFQLVKENSKPNYFSNVHPTTFNGGTAVRFPAQVDIPSTDRIKDAHGKVRNIRYLLGAKSIFVDEMTPEEKSNPIEHYLKIVNGQIVAPGYDKCLVDFLFLSNWNRDAKGKIVDKPDEYFLVDREAHFSKIINKGVESAKARDWCISAPIDDIVNYALILYGTDFVFNNNKSTAELRVDLSNTAALNPTKFMADKDTESTYRKGIIIRAIHKGIIVKNLANNSVAWSNNPGNPFSIAPIGIDTITHCVAGTFTPDGETIFAEVLKRLMPKVKAEMVSNAKDTIVEDVELQTTKKEIDTDPFGALIDNLVAKGVLKESGTWLYFGEKKWAGKKNMKAAMRESEELRNSLDWALGRVDTILE
jgi:hypothetical protein